MLEKNRKPQQVRLGYVQSQARATETGDGAASVGQAPSLERRPLSRKRESKAPSKIGRNRGTLIEYQVYGVNYLHTLIYTWNYVYAELLWPFGGSPRFWRICWGELILTTAA